MNETVITVVGNVATEPQLRVTTDAARGWRASGSPSTERRFDKALPRWRDGDTTFCDRDLLADAGRERRRLAGRRASR